MTPAAKTLDSVEEQCRIDGFAVFVSGRLRIDCRFIADTGTTTWAVDGRPCSRATAEAALEAARRAKGHPFAYNMP